MQENSKNKLFEEEKLCMSIKSLQVLIKQFKFNKINRSCTILLSQNRMQKALQGILGPTKAPRAYHDFCNGTTDKHFVYYK